MARFSPVRIAGLRFADAEPRQINPPSTALSRPSESDSQKATSTPSSTSTRSASSAATTTRSQSPVGSASTAITSGSASGVGLTSSSVPSTATTALSTSSSTPRTSTTVPTTTTRPLTTTSTRTTTTSRVPTTTSRAATTTSRPPTTTSRATTTTPRATSDGLTTDIISTRTTTRTPSTTSSATSRSTTSRSRSTTSRSTTSRSTASSTRPSTTRTTTSRTGTSGSSVPASSFSDDGPSTISTESGTMGSESDSFTVSDSFTESDSFTASDSLTVSDSATAPSFAPTSSFSGDNSGTSTDSVGAQQQSTSNSPTSLAENRANASILKNTTASALIFTFTALAIVALLGLLFYFAFWRRRSRRQHVMLGDGDDGHSAAGILRNNSSSSHASRHRPMSGVSALSSGTDPHYLPTRHAGVAPLNRGGFDTTRIEQDPFSVHRVVYPDRVPSPTDDTGRYVLYPDPVPPPAPMRFVAPRPPQPQSLQGWAGMWDNQQPSEVAPVMAAASGPVSHSPHRVKVPPLVPSPPSSADGHFSDQSNATAAFGRAQSPESHYDGEDANSVSVPRRTYLIDRRPDKRSSQ